MKPLRLYIAILCMFVGMAAGKAQSSSAVDDSVARSRALDYYYLQARSLFEQGSVDQCYEMLEHCLSIDPHSSAVMYDLALFYTILNKDSIAHEFLKKIVEDDPLNRDYNTALVNYYYKVGDKAAAIEVYEKLLENPRLRSTVYMALYNIYYELGEHEKAIEMLDRLEKIEGRDETITINKLQQYMILQDSVSAVALVEELIAENPGDVRWVTLLGDTYMMLGNRDAALESYNRALAVDPDDIYTLTSLSELYVNDNNDSLYCATIEKVLKNEGLDVSSRVGALLKYIEYRLPADSAHVDKFMQEMVQLPFDEVEIAEVYVQYLLYLKKDSSLVIPVLEKILTIEPENRAAMLQMLVYAIERNDYESVVKYADNALMYIPDMLELYYYKGLSYYLLGRKEESLEVYKQGLEHRSDEASMDLVSTVYTVMGDTYHELDMVDECMHAYDSALVYNPTNINVLNNYAYYLALENKDLQRALEMSHKTILEEPDNPIYIDTYAWVLFLLERYEEAKAYAEKMMERGEEMSSVEYHHCGDIFAMCGDTERALFCWKKARELGDDAKILNKKIKKKRYYREKKKRK